MAVVCVRGLEGKGKPLQLVEGKISAKAGGRSKVLGLFLGFLCSIGVVVSIVYIIGTWILIACHKDCLGKIEMIVCFGWPLIGFFIGMEMIKAHPEADSHKVSAWEL